METGTSWTGLTARIPARRNDMADQWTFGPARDSVTTYADGTVVPHRTWQLFLNGVLVGEIDTHMHRRRGGDGKLDTSFGFTSIVYSPPAGGR